MPICIKCKKDKKYGVSIDKNCDFDTPNLDCIFDRCTHEKGVFTCFDCRHK